MMTKTLSFKVTEEEYAQLKQDAVENHRSVSSQVRFKLFMKQE